MKKIIVQENYKVKNIDGKVNELKHSLWYGGTIAEIILTDKVKFSIKALGDVIGDVYIGDEYVTKIKDKNNQGTFYSIITDYTNILSDSELEASLTDYIEISSDIKEEFKNRAYSINLNNNNWFEMFLYVDSEIISLGDFDGIISNSIYTDEAIEEFTKMIPNILDDVKNYEFDNNETIKFIEAAIESIN